MSTDFTEQSKALLQETEIHEEWLSDYLNPDMNKFFDEAFADIVARTGIGPANNVLDAGCGYCHHTVRLARSRASITGVDFSSAALAAGLKTINRAGLSDQIRLVEGDLTSLLFESEAFDAVVCWGVLMHVPELTAALRELTRVLKPGGWLVLCENNARSLDVRIRERVINQIRYAIGRRDRVINDTERGLEVWHQSANGGLMVRKTDMRFLEKYLAEQSMELTHRRAAQFSEAYTSVPFRFLKKFVYAANAFYFKMKMSPDLAMGNILFFRKVGYSVGEGQR